MQRFALFLAAAASTVYGRECDVPDFAPFNSLWVSCRIAANLPSQPTGTDMLNACKFSECVQWYKKIATLTCTLDGSPTTGLGTMCSMASTAKPSATPSGATTTLTPSSSGVPCTAADYTPLSTIYRTCWNESGIANITMANLPIYCSYPSCVQYVRGHGTLTCIENGGPVSEFATACDRYVKDTPTTTAKSSSGSTECTTKDTPASFPRQLQSCLYFAGLTAVPTSLAGLVRLCEISDCSSALKMYAGLTCTVQGLPASALGSACVGVTAKPTTESPTTAASTTTKPVVVSSASALAGSFIVVAVAAMVV